MIVAFHCRRVFDSLKEMCDQRRPEGTILTKRLGHAHSILNVAVIVLILMHYGKDNIARNNIIALGRDQQVYLGRSDKDSSMRFERNIVYCEEEILFVRESRLEADHNVYWNIIRGLIRRCPGVDIVRVQELDLAGVEDPILGMWDPRITSSVPGCKRLLL